MATSGEETTLTDNVGLWNVINNVCIMVGVLLQCTLISIKIKPSIVIETNSSKRTPTWSITITGQVSILSVCQSI